jgi:hypothetical protein
MKFKVDEKEDDLLHDCEKRGNAGCAFVCLKQATFAKKLKQAKRLINIKHEKSDIPKVEYNTIEKVKFNLLGLKIDRAFIEEDIEWGNINSNTFHMFIEKILWILLIFTLSVFFVTPVAIYSIVDPMRDKLVEEFTSHEKSDF